LAGDLKYKKENSMQTMPAFKSLSALILALCPLVADAQTSIAINVNANASISLAGYPPSQLMLQPQN
jgi:hypothetical protein